MSYLRAVISACKAKACDKAKGCFDLFHADAFPLHSRNKGVVYGNPGLRMGQHPTACRMRKGKENIATVTGQQQHPYKCRVLPSKLFSWGDEVP